jgi:hypothetical protein
MTVVILLVKEMDRWREGEVGGPMHGWREKAGSMIEQASGGEMQAGSGEAVRQ